MNLSYAQQVLEGIAQVQFVPANDEPIPPHFHVTEVGCIQKPITACGGTIWVDSVINFQLFTATDYDHLLSASKLASLIGLSEKQPGPEDLEIKVEYLGDLIGKYGLEFEEGSFLLPPAQTGCLAVDTLGIPQKRPRINLSSLRAPAGLRKPDSGRCSLPFFSCKS